MIYLDNAASTPVHPEVLSTLLESFEKDFANPSAGHSLGKKQQKLIESVRLDFLRKLGASGGELIFTSSATEANSTILMGVKLNSGDKVLYNPADHPSLVQPMERLKEKGVIVIKVATQMDGLWDLIKLEEYLDSSVKLVCLGHVNNQTGIHQHAGKLGNMLKEYPDCHFHLDGMQALGKIEINLDHLNVDSYSMGAHKIYGPKGIGALYIKKGVTVAPLLLGGSQQHGFRSGTECTPLVLAFQRALEISHREREQIIGKVMELNKFTRKALEAGLSGKVEFPYSLVDTVPHILMMKIKGISSDIILRHMEEENIYISSGSACSSKIKGFNPVFEALGFAREYHKNFLRISFGAENTLEQIEIFCNHLVETVEELEGFMR